MVIQTTVATQFDEQDLSRHLLIELPDEPSRTDAVLTLMGDKYAGLSDATDDESVVEKHRAIHRLLPAGIHVVVPFAPELAKRMPRDRITVLRTLRMLFSLIKASALLHIRHRQLDDHGRIIAELADYRMVYDHAGEFVTRSMASSSATSAALEWLSGLLQALADNALERADADDLAARMQRLRLGSEQFRRDNQRWHKPLTLEEIVDVSGTPRTTVQRHIQQLVAAELVSVSKYGRAKLYCLATADGQLPTCPQLPTPDELERGHVGTSCNLILYRALEGPDGDGLPTSEEGGPQ